MVATVSRSLSLFYNICIFLPWCGCTTALTCVLLMDPQAVETERYRSELAEVRAELEPWEKQLIEHKGKLEVAHTESKLLTDKVMLVICIEMVVRTILQHLILILSFIQVYLPLIFFRITWSYYSWSLCGFILVCLHHTIIWLLVS